MRKTLISIAFAVIAGVVVVGASAVASPRDEDREQYSQSELLDMARGAGHQEAVDPLTSWLTDCLEERGEDVSYQSHDGYMAYDGDPEEIITCLDTLVSTSRTP